MKGAQVGVLGLTFKEDVHDLRNSKVPDIVTELSQFGIDAIVHDPLADPHEAHEEYGLEITPLENLTGLDAVIYAVAHPASSRTWPACYGRIPDRGVLVDVKSALPPRPVPPASGTGACESQRVAIRRYDVIAGPRQPPTTLAGDRRRGLHRLDPARAVAG